jgi:hypothetical protein
LSWDGSEAVESVEASTIFLGDSGGSSGIGMSGGSIPEEGGSSPGNGISMSMAKQTFIVKIGNKKYQNSLGQLQMKVIVYFTCLLLRIQFFFKM